MPNFWRKVYCNIEFRSMWTVISDVDHESFLGKDHGHDYDDMDEDESKAKLAALLPKWDELILLFLSNYKINIVFQDVIFWLLITPSFCKLNSVITYRKFS